MTEKGHVDGRPIGEGGKNGPQQALREFQDQSPLQLGQERKEGRVLQEGEMPALQPFHCQALGRGTAEPVHAEPQFLNVSQTNGHGRERPHGRPMKQQGPVQL